MVVCQHVRTNEGNKSFHRPLLYHYYETSDSMHNIKPLTGYRRKRDVLCNLSFPLFFIICYPSILPSSMVFTLFSVGAKHTFGASPTKISMEVGIIMTTMEGMKSYIGHACMIAAVNMKGGA